MKKTILITGSTDGIGKLAAIKLAKEGHEIFLHGRNQSKLEQVVAEIKTLSNNPNIKGFVADFSDLNEVKSMAQDIYNTSPKLDVLINNAGVFKSKNATTPNGFDIRFVVNYFAPYLLTHKLMPSLQKGAAPRMINLSSAAQAPIAYEALQGSVQLSAQAAYAQSKLALTMWSFYLAKQYPNIAVIALNPGSLLNTNMVREAYGHHWSPADKGANIIYDLAISEQYSGITGKYFDNDKGIFGKAHQDAYQEAAITQLIRQTDTLLSN